MLRSLIQRAAPDSVQPRWDGWLRRRDETSAGRASGTVAQPTGADARLSFAAAYAIVIILIAVSCSVSMFSEARDISWRLAAPHNLWEPALWEITSGVVVAALVPLARWGAVLTRAGRPLRAAVGIAALFAAFAALHLVGMGLLRELAYHLAGWSYAFPFAHQALYEARKDLFSFAAIAVMFWLAERSVAAAPLRPEHMAASIAEVRAAPAELWLRDGRTSILIDPSDIVSVVSAGNYVEFQLTHCRRHLIRTTLQAEAARLSPFGIVRVHRSRLINPRRIVALQWRASGDFELRLDSGETVTGSRRFKAAVAGIAT
jgi:DNA-binding LytR/AlgR family response regulator